MNQENLIHGVEQTSVGISSFVLNRLWVLWLPSTDVMQSHEVSAAALSAAHF